MLPLISKDKKELLQLKILSEKEIDEIIDAVLEINYKIVSMLLTEIREKNIEIDELKEQLEDD